MPNADPKDFFEVDRRLGYQVPRMWYPHARPETNSRQLSQPPPRADPLERAQRPHTSDLVRDEYYTQSAYASYTALGEDDERHPLGEALLESDEEGGGAAGSLQAWAMGDQDLRDR